MNELERFHINRFGEINNRRDGATEQYVDVKIKSLQSELISEVKHQIANNYVNLQAQMNTKFSDLESKITKLAADLDRFNSIEDSNK